MWKKPLFIFVFALLLVGVNALIYTLIPDSVWRYILIGVAFSTIVIAAQTVNKKWFPKNS